MVLTLALLLALLNSPGCCGELRARDPDLEEDEHVERQEQGRTTVDLPLIHGHHSFLKHPANSAPSLREPPEQRGNWCAHVTQRMVTRAVLCATETNTVKSVKPCPDEDPDCKPPMHRLSTRPMYKQKQMVLSALLWKCCPGYGGHNCLEKGAPLETDVMEDETWTDKSPEEAAIQESSQKQSLTGTLEKIAVSQPLPFLDSSILLGMHQLMSTMMSQIQPVLESFNQTLGNLSSKVEALSLDLQQLKKDQEHNRTISRGEDDSGPLREKLKDGNLQISHMKTQLDAHKEQTARAFQRQQELLMHNLTKIKEAFDNHANQSQEAEVNLRSLNVAVEEVRHAQKKLEETMQIERPVFVGMKESQPTQMSKVWDAITRIDEQTQSDSTQLRRLSEGSDGSARLIQDLQTNILKLGQSLEEVKQRNEVFYVETGLEVEATRVKVLNSLDDLTANLSAHEGQLREIDLDLDNIFILLQRNDSGFGEQTCNCKSITSSLLVLEHEVANLTQLARQYSFELEEVNLERTRAMEIEDLHQGLLILKESLAFEQGKSRSLQDSVYQLQDTLLESQQEIQGLREQGDEVSAEIRGLSATFSSLLNDAVRHSEVLEVLLGEEVLEFTRWSDSQKTELSIPDLLHRVQLMHQKIEAHDRSLTSLWRIQSVKNDMNSDDPVVFSVESTTKSQEINTEEEDVDYSISDFWSLGKEVEQLAGRITVLEEHCNNCTAPPGGPVVELQTDIASLRQNLEDHLRMFQNIFTNTQELVTSSRSLNLDDLWKLLVVFQARQTGIYLLILSLALERGLSLAVLKNSGVTVAFFKQEQGEMTAANRASLLELQRGETVTL
ncbi:hypothetical protein DNTS_035688 [Danionella cerebrum]|uniref:EMI domain-containing protein n=1 Tax=Danionella cerebrum TaxID=2873325 RepID=A0A553RDY1_9TELE|nr:hypothetical protein DNTS_035688 [Danionella translucida]